MSERRAYVVGVWKIPYADRELAHELITEEDDRAFFSVIGADTPDDDQRFPVGSKCTYRVMLTDAEAERLRTASNCRYIELDQVVEPTATPWVGNGADPIPRVATLEFMEAEFAGSHLWHGRDVTVGIVDSGTTTAVRTYMNITMLDQLVNSPDAPGSDEITYDHGCRTTADAVPAGGQFMEALSASNTGSVLSSDATAAWAWLADNGCKIISFSFSQTTPSSTFQDGVEYLRDHEDGMVHIYCSSGNGSSNLIGYPGGYCTTFLNVHSLANVDEATGELNSGSNYDNLMTGLVPGTDVMGLWPDGTVRIWSGTSASAPHAARLCAMVCTGGLYTVDEAAAALRAYTRPLGLPTEQEGNGAFSLERALQGLGALDRSWEVISGPDQVGEVLSWSVDVEFTPTVAGDYVLRYSLVTDAFGTLTDDVTLTVEPLAPTAPTVNAGADVASHPADTAFTRTATESANGATITDREWLILGDDIVIGTAAALDWTPEAGDYTLQYSATNSAGTGTDTMDITVVAPSAPTVGAGANVASHLVNTQFSRTATEDNGGATITDRAWAIVSGPVGIGTVIATAAALSWTPTTAGTYVLEYAATNVAGTGTDQMSITVEAGPQPPGSVFDLSNFKWQGPFEDPDDEGDVIEVEPPELLTYLDEDYFYLDSSLRMVFKAPCQGFTTSGSGSSRSELREMEAGIEASWTPFDEGVRQLTVTERIDPTSLTDRQEIIIGQIHAGENPAIYIAAEWESSGAPVTPRLRVFKDNLSGGSSGVGNMLSGSLSTTTDFTWRIRVENDTVSVYAAVGGVGNLPGTANFSFNATSDFADDVGWYFKKGAYNKSTVQDGGTGTAISTVSYLQLIQGEEPPPPVTEGGFLLFFGA